MKKIFTLLFVLSFGLLFSNTSKINDGKIVACPTATISYSGTPFCTNTTMPQNVFLTGTDAYMGGVFSSLPVGLAIDPITGAITPSLSIPGTYTVTYTIPSGGGCPSVMATATVTVQGSAQITPTSAFMNQTVCTFQPIINITAATTNATGATAFGLPPGVTLAWSSNTATIFGVPTNPGAYNYTIITTGGCSTANYSGTILVLPYSTATIGTNQTICSGNTATIAFTGTANATVSYTINGGVNQNITLNSSGFATLSTTPLTSNTVYNLVSVSSSTGCSNPTSGSAVITVMPNPTVVATPSSETINSGLSTNIFLSSPVPGTTYTWTSTSSNVTGASAGSGNTISQILTLNNTSLSGSATYAITPSVNGCIGPQTFVDIIVNPNLGTNNFNSQNFIVSPNPVIDVLNIKNNQIINKVTAFNQLGQMVLEKDYNNNEVQLDFSDLKTGIYFILVDSDKKQSTFKIVKN